MRSNASFRALLTLLLASALSCSDDRSPATAPESPQAPAIAAATALAFAQLSGGLYHTCGVTLDQRAYCWGLNSGNLGDGTTVERLTPTAVATTLPFRQISAGVFTTCGVTTDFVAYCWGANDHGVLGNGTTARQLAPVKVAGGHRFLAVETNGFHTCGVSYPDNLAYCWGENYEGQLGDGTRTDRLTPVPVARGLVYRQLTAGEKHTCGVTTDGFLFCWGSNRYGQLGDSSTAVRRIKPSRVSRTRRWYQVDAGGNTSCALTAYQAAFCWGDGREGQLGNGQRYLSFWPRKVATGALTFTRVTVGWRHTCAEAKSKLAYCWGSNLFGGLGVPGGSQTFRAAVTGGHEFVQVSAGGYHTCGETEAGAAWCWGYNAYGQLGDGTIESGFEPRLVAGAN
jgi:alpha-tubulin suppressor-like RCC1 family protein